MEGGLGEILRVIYGGRTNKYSHPLALETPLAVETNGSYTSFLFTTHEKNVLRGP